MRFCHWGNQPANGKKEKESNRLKKLLQQREKRNDSNTTDEVKAGTRPGGRGRKGRRILRIPAGQIASCSVAKQSIDARKKPEIWYSYVVDITLKSGDEDKVIRKCRNADVTRFTPVAYHFPGPGTEKMQHRPLIIGMGPAGLFCGYMLARAGYRPILLERGSDVQTRSRDVEAFWAGRSMQAGFQCAVR